MMRSRRLLATVAAVAVALSGPILLAPSAEAAKRPADIRVRYLVSATVDAQSTWNTYVPGECSLTGSGSETIRTRPPKDGITIVNTVWEFRSYVPKGKKDRVWTITQVRPAPTARPVSDLVLPSVRTDVTVQQADSSDGPCQPPEAAVRCTATHDGTLTLEILEGAPVDVVAGSGENGTALSINSPVALDLRAYGDEIPNGCGGYAQCPYQSFAGCNIDGTTPGSDADLVAPLVEQLPWSKTILRPFSRKAIDAGKADFTRTLAHRYTQDVLGLGTVQGYYNVTLTFDRMP